MNIVDSSGWLESFAGGPNAGFFESAINRVADLVAPSVSVYEVFKRVYQQRGESEGLIAVALMEQRAVVDLDSTLALSAAKILVKMRLPMADSSMLATPRLIGAVWWTQDADFEGTQGVRYTPVR